MSRHHHRRHRLKIKSLYVWHRYLGVTAAVFVLALSVTGLALNHTERFQWDSRHVTWPWVLDWYGIGLPTDRVAYPAGDRLVTLYGGRLYLGEAVIDGHYEELRGAIALPDMIAVGLDDNILLLTPEGEIIERLGANEGVPAAMQAMGLSATGRLLFRGREAIYHADADLLRLQHWDGDPASAQWVQAVAVPTELETELAARFRTSVLPLERVLLDLHSGRIFGSYGVYVMDAAAIIMMLLAISGFIMWARRRR